MRTDAKSLGIQPGASWTTLNGSADICQFLFKNVSPNEIFIYSYQQRERFGMHRVDFNDPTRTRTPKDSAKYYARLIANNGFVPEEYCDSP